MEEQSSQEILEAYAENSGREVVFKEKHYPGRLYRGIQKMRKTFYIWYGNKKQIVYAGIWDNTQYEFWSSYSGFFFKIDFPAQSTVTIRKKDILDKLKLANRKKCIKTGVGDFDRRAFVTGNDEHSIQKILNKRTVQHQILKILSIHPGLSIEINTRKPDFIPDFSESSNAQPSTIGILKHQEWILKEGTIENLFQLTEHLAELMR